jgi:hypothetical protein
MKTTDYACLVGHDDNPDARAAVELVDKIADAISRQVA